LEKTKIFSATHNRREIIRIYNNWLEVNKTLWSKYFSVLAMLFMAILIPFDFLLFESPQDLFFIRFRVLSIIIFALNLYLLSIRTFPQKEKTSKNRLQLSLLMPGLLFCVLYQYFLLKTDGAAYQTVFIANFILVFFTTFFLHRFWKEQYTLNIILSLGLIVIGILRNEIISHLILFFIIIIASSIAAFFFRRDFVGTMFLRYHNRELMTAKQRAETSDQIKSVFLSTMSHELRTPLNVIFGYTDLLQMSMEDRITDEEEGFIKNINSGKNRLLKLIDEIMDISRIEAGKYALKYDQFVADELVAEIVNGHKNKAAKKNLNIIEKYKEEGIEINADKSRFTQVLNNIIDNAIIYTDTGSITIQTKSTKTEYKIQVTDTGIGIEEEFKPLLFETFRQAEEGFSRTYEGAGLGLAISKQFIEEMHGRIDVESVVGSGSTFTLIFPKESPSKKPDEKVVSSGQKKIKQKDIFYSADPKNISLLILEDNIANQKYLEKIVNKLGYSCFSESFAENALDHIKSNNISGALVDISLADQMDGFEFLQRVRQFKQFKEIPMIAVTAHKVKGIEAECYEKGFDDFLAKPFTLKSLKVVLDRHFRSLDQ